MIRPYALSARVDRRSEALHTVWCGSSKYPNHNIAQHRNGAACAARRDLRSLSFNELSADGARAIAEALKTNTALQQLA
eukprot:CAMPEP_0202092664 /NCGR_PEP_ID=MMETSP0964-20121228/48151_1 /ASSEMBLY_ACC=CAM_ASM_000500 /TAXON_ID=4773 /ORGANISM="Schizochytrium aggregatum, Strain ATCC28209" /LENGTH=78 /DNA_ID=CAMNT_0048660907 /DNA_START=190 /DNA_END=426 /DNA_ORIENTATION=-